MARLYIDMDDVLCEFSLAHARDRERFPNVPYPQSLPGFYRQLAEIRGAVEAVNQLRGLSDLWILTAPSCKNPLSYTEKRLWIEEHFDYVLTEKLIISPDKGLLWGQFLVDDQSSGRGQERFEGELIQFGTARWPDWMSVLTYLTGKLANNGTA